MSPKFADHDTGGEAAPAGDRSAAAQTDWQNWSREDWPAVSAAYEAWREAHGLGADPDTYAGRPSRDETFWAHGWVAAGGPTT